MPLAPDLHQALDAILQSVYNLQTSAGGGYRRFYSLIFRDLPDRRSYPDYYQVIKEPRCLHGIMDNLSRGIYSSPQAVAYDLFLIWNNAREYNEQGSMVYADADKLEDHMARSWQSFSPPLPDFRTLPRPGSLPQPSAAAAAPPDSSRKVKKLKLTGASLGTPSTPTATLAGSTKLRLAPPSASASPAPSTPSLTLKLGGGRAPPAAAATPATALPPLPANIPQLPSTSGPPTSSTPAAFSPSVTAALPPMPAATGPSSAIVPKKEEKEDGEGEDGPPIVLVPTVPDVESGWMTGEIGVNPTATYLDIVRRLREYTDATGRVLAEPLNDLPDPLARPDYYQSVPNPVSLNSIEGKVKDGSYASTEEFDRELHHLFESNKLVTRPETPGPAYSDLLVLQRLYQELTKRRSPLERAANADSTALILGSTSGGVGEGDLKSRATTRPTTKDKIFLDGINYKGDVLRTGDWVHIFNPDYPAKPVIAQIWKVYKRPDSPQRCVTVCWYYRPEETVHPVSRMFYENEVFKSGVFIDHNVEEVVGRCFVMFFTRYIRGRPQPPAWTEGMPLYVCEYRYKDDVKSFKKIKSWNSCVPEEIRHHEYDYEPYPDGHVDTLPKVKSPFVRGVAEAQKAAAPVYHFSPQPAPAAVEETLPAVKPPPADELPAMDIDIAEDTTAMDAAAAAAFAQSLSFDVSSFAAGAVNPPLPAAAPQQPVFFDLGASAAAPAPASALASPAVAATPAELAAATEFFAPLPGHIKSKFRNDTLGDLLWFTAPAADVPTVSRPTHSLEYLYWRAQQKEREEQARETAMSV
ncbi:hypothetical protein JCM8097_008324 [Rhodosporidiobolus ruineniae]